MIKRSVFHRSKRPTLRDLTSRLSLLRNIIVLIALFLSFIGGCHREAGYFGKVKPPSNKELVFENDGEPATLDPAKTSGGAEYKILDAIFEGLIQLNPATLEPMAGLATHYQANSNLTQYTFYLRGHPDPQGQRLPNINTLHEQFVAGVLSEDLSRGFHAPPDNMPARWSDGKIVTAHDFVYSWRRLVDPGTAAPFANYLYSVRNAQEVNSGKLAVKELGIRSLDDFTFQVDLIQPSAVFLVSLWTPVLVACPSHVVEDARQAGRESNWTKPGQLVSSGPFLLEKWRPFDEIVLKRNPAYYDAPLVGLERIRFLPIVDSTTLINLYKAGTGHMMVGTLMPPVFVTVLRDKKDFKSVPALWSRFYRINTRKPAFDRVEVRYALNMATDKYAIAKFLSGGQVPARSLVPRLPGYNGPDSLEITVAGKTFDVLRYDPQAARELLSLAGYTGGRSHDGLQLSVEVLFSTGHPAKLGEIVQQQWSSNLGIDVKLISLENNVLNQALIDLQYRGVAEVGWIGDYPDPAAFLQLFKSGSAFNGTGWTDQRFDKALEEANANPDFNSRLRRLSDCERILLEAMPIVPLYFNEWSFLRKPWVRGVADNVMDYHPWKYLWIDHAWKDT